MIQPKWNLFRDDTGDHIISHVECWRQEPNRDPFAIIFDDPRPPCGYYHYSNPACQGALIAETAEFPWKVDKREFTASDVWLDRIQSTDYYKEAMKIPDRCVEYANWDDEKLKRFAQLLFRRDIEPEHVRLVYYYNMVTGYSAPHVIAVFKKQGAANGEQA